MKQKYELGEFVHAFRAGKEIVKVKGYVRMAEINNGGYIQYEICTPDAVIHANHASMAHSESELDAKIAEYSKFQEEQKAIFENKFGAPEFDMDSLKGGNDGK